MVLVVTSGIFVELFLSEGCVDGIGQEPMQRALRSIQSEVVICAVDYSSEIFFRVENDFDRVTFLFTVCKYYQLGAGGQSARINCQLWITLPV